MATHSFNKSENRKIFLDFLFFAIIQILLFSQIFGQAISISGKMSASRYPVRNASITFINNADTAIHFTALTDALGNYQIGIPTSVEANTNNSPAKYELDQNYPNPFSSSTAIPYQIKKEADVEMTVFDILGRAVKKYNVEQQLIGMHNVVWDGRNDFGQRVASGVYFYRLYAGGESRIKKMVFTEGGKGAVPLPQLYSSRILETRRMMKQGIQDGYYTIQIKSTSTTSPFVIPIEYSNVLLQHDTTISFAVNFIPVATINIDSTHQVIRGFGAASPWYRPIMTTSEVDDAIGRGIGQIGLSILRFTIEPDSSGWSKYVPSAKKAQDLGAIIIASPWYAPTNIVETANTVSRVRYDKYNEYIAHLNSFNTFMKNNGVSIYGISVQNEPDITTSWTSWTPAEMLTLMKANAGALVGTKVMAPESFQFRRNMSDPILNDSIACANTDIVCGHIYGGGLSSYPLALSKGKEVWMTEYLLGDNNSGNNLSWAIKLAQNINDVMKADMSAYVWWTVVRYYGPIGDGEKASAPQDPNESYPKKGEVTKKGYVLSQFSKFIRPGFYRIESSIYPPFTGTGVDVTAYKDMLSSKVVIVAINTGLNQAECVIRMKSETTMAFTPYTTSVTKNCEEGETVNVMGGSFLINMEPSCITTFISN